MKKKIYVVKRGEKTGIYDDYKKCEAQVKGFPGAVFLSFDYRSEFEKEDENKEGSLRHAFMLAEKYMNDINKGGLKIVYQGENQDYMEEESWKKEGFLPFGEEIPDDAGSLQGEGENDDIDDCLARLYGEDIKDDINDYLAEVYGKDINDYLAGMYGNVTEYNIRALFDNIDPYEDVDVDEYLAGLVYAEFKKWKQ